MCGIVGVASNGPMTSQMKDFFQSLLFHDVVRGHHATGVAAIDTMDRSLAVVKKAVPAADFLSLKEVEDDLFAHKHNFNIYIGHNRWATSGAKDDDKNAHPFIHGDIVGVHNGSLRDQTLLDDHKSFVVDSDNLFHQMNKTGLKDTLDKTDGAFALVWYDKKDNTLNFIRNDERPLCVAKLTNGCWVWASERGMLQWLINRHKSLAFEQEVDSEDKTIKTPMIYSLEKGLHMAVPFKEKTRQMDRLSIRKLVLPTFRSAYETYYGSTYYNTNSSRGGYRQETKTQGRTPFEKERDEVIRNHLLGANYDSRVEVMFLGHIHPVTSSGYKQSISLYLHRNVWGQEMLCHAYNHAGNITSKWTDSDIGRILFGKILGMSPPTAIIAPELKNAVLQGWAVSLSELSETKPMGSYFGYTEKGDEVEKTTSEASKVVVSIEKKVETGNNVIPFENSDASKTLSSDGKEASALPDSVTLANDVLSRTRLVEYMGKNNYHCANCNKSLRTVPLSKAHVIEHYDREMSVTQVYITCSSQCHEGMEEYVSEVEEEYDRRLGNIANDKP